VECAIPNNIPTVDHGNTTRGLSTRHMLVDSELYNFL
jgi:hypothetical protein